MFNIVTTKRNKTSRLVDWSSNKFLTTGYDKTKFASTATANRADVISPVTGSSDLLELNKIQYNAIQKDEAQAKKPRRMPGFGSQPCRPLDVILLCAESGSRVTSSAAGSNRLYYYLLVFVASCLLIVFVVKPFGAYCR